MSTTIAPFVYENINNTSWNHTTNVTYYPYHFTGGLCRLETPAAVYGYAILLTALALIATIENIVVLWVMYRQPVLRQPSILILGVLALVDLITAAIVTPIKVWLTLSEAHWGSDAFISMKEVMLTFLWMFFGVVFFSLSTVLMISIDRFLHVFLLDKYSLTIKKLLLGLVISWTIPLLITICVAVRYIVSWMGWLTLVYFLLCIFLMIGAYVGMVVVLKKHRSTITDSTALCFRKSIEDERRAVKTTLIIMCTCLAMNLPPIVSIAAGFAGYASRTLCAITFFAMLGNAAVNPLIYCSRVPVIRRHVLKLFGVQSARYTADESEDYLTVVAEGDNCNIYTGPKRQNAEDA